MAQRRSRAGFALEAVARRQVVKSVGQELDGDMPAQARIFGPIDDAHTATAQTLEDPIGADRGADQRSD